MNSSEADRVPSGLREEKKVSSNYTSIPEVEEVIYPPIHLERGESPWGPGSTYFEVFKRLSESGELADSLLQYKPTDMSRSTAVLKKQFSAGPDVSLIYSPTGSDGILKEVPSLLKPQPTTNEIRLHGPCFPNIAEYAKQHRNRGFDIQIGQVRKTDLVRTALDMKPDDILDYAMERRMASRRLDRNILHYLCYPETPGGQVPSFEKLKEFVEFCNKPEIDDLLLVDEAQGDFIDDSLSTIQLIQKNPNLMTTRTMSKGAGLSGLKVGMLWANNAVAKRYMESQKPNPYYLTGFQEIIMNELVPHPQYNQHFIDIREKTPPVKLRLVNALKEKGVWVAQTDERTTSCIVGGTTSLFVEDLLHRGIIAAPGNGFSETFKGFDNTFARFTLTTESLTEEQIEEIADRTAQVAAVDKKRGSR